MAENKDKRSKAGMSAIQEGYNLAKLLRQSKRELDRQYNSKKTRRER